MRWIWSGGWIFGRREAENLVEVMAGGHVVFVGLIRYGHIGLPSCWSLSMLLDPRLPLRSNPLMPLLAAGTPSA